MKKTVAFLLVLMMLVCMIAINIYATEATNYENAQIEQGNADCSCGGSYGEWLYPTDGNCQGGRYYRECDSCDNVQTAKDITPKTVSFSVPAIGANVGDLVMLSLYDVYFTSSNVVSAENIVWSSEDIEIVNNQICPAVAGTYKLTATSGTSTKSVYVVAKNPTDTEYVLFLDDFNREELGDDYRALEIPTGTEYYISDGKLILDATGNTTNQMRVLLPEWIGDFGDYKIDTTFTILSTMNNDKSYWFATMARVGQGGYPLWQAAVRKGAKSHSSGIEIANKSSSSASWGINKRGKYTEDISADKYYTLTFDLLGTNATHSIDGTTTMSASGIKQTPGDVGFHLRASVVSVDKIKIVIPMDDTIHSFGEWVTVQEDTCVTDGMEERTCANCDVVEQRVIAKGHKIVSYALKAPSCTESGYRAYEECERCDYTTFSGEFGPLGHYFDREIKSIAHRGFSSTAPENTLPAYILAKEKCFSYVECDIALTKDGIAVLLHDETIDRTSDGSGNIAELTYEELLQYDFGSWKGSKYAGTKIPTFVEFIVLCKELGLHPYIEIKNDATYTQEQINSLVEIVEEHGMADNCTWISFNVTYLEYVKNADETARLGFVSSKSITQSLINPVLALQTGKNEVFLDISYNMLNETNVMLAMANGLPLETWTVDNTNDIKNRPKYVSGYTSNKLVAEEYLVKTAVTAPTCGAQGYTTYTCFCGATKVDDYVPATGNHTAKDGVCTECNAIVYCNNDSHNLEIISISYANGYDKEGVKVVRCLDCYASQTETKASPLFTCVGFSVPEDGRGGIALTFSLDNDAISEYETVTGKTLKYGVFAVAESKIGNNSIFDESGNVFNGAICADVTEYEFNMFDIKIVGFEDDHKSLPLAMGAYISVTEGSTTEYSYIQNSSPNKDEIYSFVSYNDIVNPKEVI